MNRPFLPLILTLALACSGAGAQDKSKATVDELIPLATKGDVRAQAELAYRYREGKDVTKDYAQAMRWGHLAADQNDPWALNFVGNLYLTGRGVKRNPALAFGYYRAAADRNAWAGYNLGQCYFSAQGVEQDVPKALTVWKRAADMGNGGAAAEAAMAYLSGEARRLAQRSADLGHASGLVLFGEFQFQAGNIDDARAKWTKAAKLRPAAPTTQPDQLTDDHSAQEAADLLKLIDHRHRKPHPGVFALVNAQHVHQGTNNCAPAAAVTLARFQGANLHGWDFKRLCASRPVGTATDWNDLPKASEKLGLHWKLLTFTLDDPGFEQGTAMLRTELDAGRPVIIDFKFIRPEAPGGYVGHTLTVAGYIATENLFILRNPAIPSPGLQLITAADLMRYWSSDHYSTLAHNVLSRPAIVIDQRTSKD